MKIYKYLAILSLIVFIIPTRAQTNIGGLQGVPPQPNIPVGPGLLSCGSFNCTGDTNGAFPGDGFWNTPTLCAPTVNTAHSPSPGQNSLQIPAPCGTTSQNGIPLSQNFVYTGGRVLQTTFLISTDATFQGFFDSPPRNQTWGGIFMGDSPGLSSPFSSGTGPGVGTNSGGFFQVFHNTYVNPFLFTGNTFQNLIRTPAYGAGGTIGNAYVSNVNVTATDYFANYVRSPWSPKGYMYDTPSVLECGGPQYPTLAVTSGSTWPVPFAGEACGILEIIDPWDSGTNAPVPLSNIIVTVLEGTAPGCSGGTPVNGIMNGVISPLSTVVASSFPSLREMWYYNGSAWPIENTPTTPHYTCTSFMVTYSSGSVTYSWPDHVTYRVSDTFRNSLMNYTDANQGWWHNGAQTMPRGWNYSATAANAVGNQSPSNWSLSHPCSQHTNPVLCFALSWNDQGLNGLPISDSTATHKSNYSVNVTSVTRTSGTTCVTAAAAPLIPFYVGEIVTALSGITDSSFNFTAGSDPITSSTGLTNFCFAQAGSNSTSSGTGATSALTGLELFNRNLMPLLSSFANMFTTWSLDVQEQPQASPVPGTLDVLGPWMEAMFDYTKGTTFVYQTNFLYGALLSGQATDVPTDRPSTGLTTPVVHATGGFMRPPAFNIDVWVDWFPVGQSGFGQSGDLQVTGMSSVGVFAGAASGIGTNSITVTAPSCSAYSTRVLGWRPGIAFTNSAVTLPSHDKFLIQQEPADTPYIPCGQTVTLVGSQSTTEAQTRGTTGMMAPANNTTVPAALACTTSCGTAAFSVVYQALCLQDCLTLPSTPTTAAVSTSLNLPSTGTCSTNGWSGIYVSLAPNSMSGKWWDFFLDTVQNPVGSPLACGGTYTTPATITAMPQTTQIPTDTSPNGLPSWTTGGQTDVQATKIAMQTMCGADSANFPNAAKAAWGPQIGDEPGPDMIRNGYYMFYAPTTGVLQWCPGLLVDNLTTDSTWLFESRYYADENVTDPYYNGTVPNADPTTYGGASRNGKMYNSTFNQCISNCQTSGTAASAIMGVRLLDVATWDWYFEGSYGLGIWNPDFQDFAIVGGSGQNSVHGFPYTELKRSILKPMIDSAATGNTSGGASGWSLESDTGVDYWTYNYANTNPYSEHVRLMGEIANPEVQRTWLSPTIDSTLSTTQPGFFPPCSNCTTSGLGKFLLSIQYYSTTTANTILTPGQICYNTLPSTVGNSYQNFVLWPNGVLTAMTKQDPVYGKWMVGQNNMCGDAATTNNTGGLPYFALETFDLTQLRNYQPFEGHIMEVVGGDYETPARTAYVFGSNALCPTITTVGPNQVCIPFSDQEAFLSWVRSPNCYTADGDIISSGDIKKACIP